MDIPENSIYEILENNPSQGTLYVLLSVMKENGRHNLVIRECLKALLQYPEDLTLRKILAEAYLEDGRLVEAESELVRVIKDLAWLYKTQAEIFVRQKRETDAINSLKQYIAFSPEDDGAAILLEELMATSAVASIELSEEQIGTDISETEGQGATDIMDAQESDEFPEIITASLAETYFDQGKLAEAREIYEKLIENDPEDASIQSRLNEISAMMEPKDEPEEKQVDDTARRKKERMISILDSWRNNIRDLAEEGVTASDI
jgi:tetratricopeptide (TPR) repeat protein